jgi:hypothetical protein
MKMHKANNNIFSAFLISSFDYNILMFDNTLLAGSGNIGKFRLYVNYYYRYESVKFETQHKWVELDKIITEF